MVNTRRTGAAPAPTAEQLAIARGGNAALRKLLGVKKPRKTTKPRKSKKSARADDCCARAARLQRIVDELRRGRAKTAARAARTKNNSHRGVDLFAPPAGAGWGSEAAYAGAAGQLYYAQSAVPARTNRAAARRHARAPGPKAKAPPAADPVTGLAGGVHRGMPERRRPSAETLNKLSRARLADRERELAALRAAKLVSGVWRNKPAGARNMGSRQVGSNTLNAMHRNRVTRRELELAELRTGGRVKGLAGVYGA
jgi:hypothetical protein